MAMTMEEAAPPVSPGPIWVYPSPPPRRTGWVVAVTLLTGLLGLSLLVNLVLLGGAALLGSGAEEAPARRMNAITFKETAVGGPARAADKLLLLPVGGLIRGSSHTGDPDNLVSVLEAQLALAAADPGVKGILLKINSPGGEVTAADRIYHMIREFRDETGRPVVALLESLAASGGYYVAAAADGVLAHPLTITGSIGVIMGTFEMSELLGRIGVKPQVFTSGSHKDTLSLTRPMTEEERVLIDALVQQSFDRFVEAVCEGRGKTREELAAAEVLDGRVLTGEQAREAGLVDRLGTFDDAVAWLSELARTRRARLVCYRPARRIWDQLLSARGAGAPARIELDLAPGPAAPWDLEPGVMYYLSPHGARF